MRKLLREPLLHFLVLGALLFAAHALAAGRRRDEGPPRIVITRGRIEQLIAGFSRTWQRPPTEEELDGLVEDELRNEVCCREAVALGLDRDDVVIRRRLRQKLEFVSEDLAALAEPSEEQLEAYLRDHPAAFRTDDLITFRSVYLDPTRHEGTLAKDAAELLAKLNGEDVDAQELGDPFLLERDFDSAPLAEIGKQFGEAFAAQLKRLPPGRWKGPIESGLGAHLVLVAARTGGRLPGLDEVRAAVRLDWENAQRLEAAERRYQELLKQYDVAIEERKPPGERKKG